MNRTRMTVLALAGAAALALAGCSDDDDSGSSAADPDSGASQEAPPEPEEPAAEEESPAAEPKEVEVTPPGTKLKIGDTAVVPYDRAGATGHIGITVTGVSDVDKAAFDAALGENGDADITPFCVEFTIENADGSDLGGSYPPDLTGVTADGGDSGATVFGADIEGCEEGVAPDEFAEAGASYETKRLQGAGPGASVAGASYEEDGYEDDPVVWTP
ncbi:hypothetical protein [Streptomyces phytophilus]|uniref:hypothetical protein n=1 Tax=Streptomyces phytophilus TaxID=722715 RepID=UPI002867DEE8|nr:hypothetical protein [Streptomyces phytophilus]